jgi:hypothetical protein
MKNGVIDTATGDLLRCGYCDFENDGSFNPVVEAIRNDAPEVSPVMRVGESGTYKRWNGTVWVDVAQPTV